MIYAVRMRGNTDAGNFAGLSTSFTDLYDTWYRGYVKWAQAAGIIDGKSATTFDPNGSVTGTEAAKMLLVLAGYTSDRAGLTGVNWETNTIRYASQAGLLDNMDNVDLSQALPREYAAQLIYNALFIPMVRWSNDSQSFEELTNTTQAGDGGANSITTVGLQYMGLRFFEGTFDGNYQTDSTLRDGYVTFTGTSGSQEDEPVTVAYDLDLAWIGEEVEVLYQDNNLRGDINELDPNDSIYGINQTGDTTVYNITKGDLQNATNGADKIRFGGVNYDASTDITVYVNYVEQTGDTYTAADFDDETGTYYGNSADTIKFIVNEDGVIDTAYILNKTVGVITTLTDSRIAIRGMDGDTLEFDDTDITVYEGAERGDIVYFYTLFNESPAADGAETIVEEAAIVSGEVTALRTSNGITTITIDGTNYEQSITTDGQANIDPDGYDTTVEIGDEYEVVLYGNYWVGAKALTEESNDFAMITASSYNAIDGYRVRMLLADGTTTTATVHEDSEDLFTDDNPIDEVNEAILVAYTMTDDGVKLTKIEYVAPEDDETENDFVGTLTDDATAYTKSTQTLTYTNSNVGAPTPTVVASNAVAFIYYVDEENADNNEWRVYSIADLGDVTADTSIITGITGRANDDGYVVVFAMGANDIDSTVSGDDLVGVVVDSDVTGWTTTVDGETITYYTVWDGAEEHDVKFEEGTTGIAQGDFIKITDFNADEIYTADVEITPTAIKVDLYEEGNRIVAIDDSDNTRTSYNLADGYAIIGFSESNDDTVTGVEMDTVPEYTRQDTTVPNALIVLNDDEDEVTHIFVDSDNEID